MLGNPASSRLGGWGGAVPALPFTGRGTWVGHNLFDRFPYRVAELKFNVKCLSKAWHWVSSQKILARICPTGPLSEFNSSDTHLTRALVFFLIWQDFTDPPCGMAIPPAARLPSDGHPQSSHSGPTCCPHPNPIHPDSKQTALGGHLHSFLPSISSSPLLGLSPRSDMHTPICLVSQSQSQECHLKTPPPHTHTHCPS